MSSYYYYDTIWTAEVRTGVLGGRYGANDASATAGFFAICLLLHGRGSLFQAGTVFFASSCIFHYIVR